MAFGSCVDRVGHRSFWVVSARHGYPDPQRGMRWRVTASSTVWCPECKIAWRTSAMYVQDLPDADRSTDGEMPFLTNRQRQITQLVEEYPLLVELTYYQHKGSLAHSNNFLTDLGYRLTTFGSLTLRQIVTAESAIMDRMERQGKRDTHLAENALESGITVPSGAYGVRGLILSVWHEGPETHDTAYERTRMRVRADEGFIVECTVPAGLLRRHGEGMSGRRISMPITLKPKWDVPGEAWGSYPSQDSRLLDEEEK